MRDRDIAFIGLNLKAIRLARYATQRDAAADVDVPQEALSVWESGVRIPTIANLIKIADTYKLPLDALVREPTPTALRRIEKSKARRSA